MWSFLKKLTTENKKMHIITSGLNNLDYEVLSKKEIYPNVVLIKVKV